MRFCSFVLKGEGPDRTRGGVVLGSRVFETDERRSLEALLATGSDLRSVGTVGSGYDLEEVALRAPILRPKMIVAAIVNTQGMLGGRDVGLDRPRLDMKAPSAVIGPGERILAPKTGIRPEVELAAIIGQRISRATKEQAEAAIAGYTILNDVTAPSDSREDAYEAYRRDKGTGKIAKTRLRGPLFRSKNHDTFCPMGPWMATPDEAPDWSKVRMTTRFEGALIQEGSSAEYIFAPARIASYVSGFLTLEPGDVVSSGSVGWTADALGALDPIECVLPPKGGTLELEIDGIGKLVNPVSAETG